MKREVRVAWLILFVASLLALSFSTTGRIGPPTGDAAIWFHAGLLMLVIGVYWIEHFFTRPADVVVNSLVVFVSVSTLNDPPNPAWWDLLRYGSLVLLHLSLVSILLGDRPRKDSASSRAIRLSYDLSISLGSAKVLFSTVFFLALVSYFDLAEPETRWVAIFWLVVVLVSELRIDQLVSRAFASHGRDTNILLGTVSRFLEPGVIRFSLEEGANCGIGDVVAFAKKGEVAASTPLALVVNHRRTMSQVEVETTLLSGSFRSGEFDDRLNAYSADVSNASIARRLTESRAYQNRHSLVGVVKERSAISHVFIEVFGGHSLSQGHMVGVMARGNLVYYQVTDSVLCEEVTMDGSRRVFTTAQAAQLGTWSSNNRAFEPYAWSPPENASVFVIATQNEQEPLNSGDIQSIGRVPNSDFLVDVRLADLVLYHTAILGVTGTGKSYLAFDLVERLAANGTKVICLDVTGDYARYINGAVRLATPAAIQPFLSDVDSPNVGIIEFSENTHPIPAALAIAERAKEWCEANRTVEDLVTPSPKVLLVLEEAHTLVPEWNFNPERQHQATVSQISQVVLQARKYGLGFCIVTQRTANVTKSILNQCNTIFSFQAFDETGFDFLTNYIGREYVRALPSLKERHGVFVGKASSSHRPLIVKFNDQRRRVRADPIDTYVPPVVAD